MKRLLLASIVTFVTLAAASPADAQTCTGTPEQIVSCEQIKSGGAPVLVQPLAIVHFLRNVAESLNAAGVPGGPFGILVKTGGNQCGGYSCDIICSGQGAAQRQWDVLIDAGGRSEPTWHGPLPEIAIRPCEIVSTPSPAPTPVPSPAPSGITHEDLADDLLQLGKILDALEARIITLTDRVDVAAAASLSAAQLAADIKGIVSVGTGVPAVLPPYRGKLWGISIVSQPCPECR